MSDKINDMIRHITVMLFLFYGIFPYMTAMKSETAINEFFLQHSISEHVSVQNETGRTKKNADFKFPLSSLLPSPPLPILPPPSIPLSGCLSLYLLILFNSLSLSSSFF